MTRVEGNDPLFVTFEGIDGSGKSTQVDMLRDSLRDAGYEVAVFREPGATAIGERVRKILLDADHSEMAPATELFLYAAARAQLTEEAIKPALDENDVVICDRYLDSTTVYQGYGRGIDISLVEQVNQLATGSLRPHLTFVLDIDIRVGDTRGATEDRLERETAGFKERLREGYRRLAEEESSRVILIDGTRPPRDIANEVWRRVAERLPEARPNPVLAAVEGEGR